MKTFNLQTSVFFQSRLSLLLIMMVKLIDTETTIYLYRTDEVLIPIGISKNGYLVNLKNRS